MPAEGYSVSAGPKAFYTPSTPKQMLQKTTRKSNRKSPAWSKIEEICFNMYLCNSVDKYQ